MKIREIGRRVQMMFKEPESIYVEDKDDITDEIEKSMLELKEAYDLSTEEVEMSLLPRKIMKLKK